MPELGKFEFEYPCKGDLLAFPLWVDKVETEFIFFLLDA